MSRAPRIRVLLADDTATTRELIRAILESEPDLEVVALARDGAEALALCHRHRPDLVLMDVRMPVLDGYEATRRIMREVPTPIVVFSATFSDADLSQSLEATRAGAVALLPRPVGPAHERFDQDRRQLVRTVRTMAGVKVVKRWSRAEASTGTAAVAETAPRLLGAEAVVGIATSTGGPAALHTLLGALPASFPAPILIVQHIAEGFVEGLARWLDLATALRVRVAQASEPLEPGCAYLAPSGLHLGLAHRRQAWLSAAEPLGGFRPSASFLFESLGSVGGRGAIAVVLTGMGDDGTRGLAAVRQGGGRILVQDAASSVVFGMPASAIAAGLADEILPLERVAPRLVALVA